MTDNQDPLQALQKIIESKEKPSAAPSSELNQGQNEGLVTPEGQASGGEELSPGQQAALQVAQEAANAAKEAELRAQHQEHEQQQAAKDREAIESLRGELPEVAPTSLLEGDAASNPNQDLSQETNNQETGEKTAKEVSHQVEQLKRLD
ncbi:MAG: hypothetical protein GX943_01380 [Candidatus Pacebacteria bacterium]|nr:hypothetical protein [Candidatus Paceibacterota bacterium]